MGAPGTGRCGVAFRVALRAHPTPFAPKLARRAAPSYARVPALYTPVCDRLPSIFICARVVTRIGIDRHVKLQQQHGSSAAPAVAPRRRARRRAPPRRRRGAGPGAGRTDDTGCSDDPCHAGCSDDPGHAHCSDDPGHTSCSDDPCHASRTDHARDAPSHRQPSHAITSHSRDAISRAADADDPLHSRSHRHPRRASQGAAHPRFSRTRRRQPRRASQAAAGADHARLASQAAAGGHPRRRASQVAAKGARSRDDDAAARQAPARDAPSRRRRARDAAAGRGAGHAAPARGGSARDAAARGGAVQGEEQAQEEEEAARQEGGARGGAAAAQPAGTGRAVARRQGGRLRRPGAVSVRPECEQPAAPAMGRRRRADLHGRALAIASVVNYRKRSVYPCTRL